MPQCNWGILRCIGYARAKQGKDGKVPISAGITIEGYVNA